MFKTFRQTFTRKIRSLRTPYLLSVFAIFTLAPTANAQETLNVVATTGMIADAVREVGGEQVTVRALMGPGVDPHAYRQTRSDIVAMTKADLVLSHGLYLEAQMEEFLEKMGKSKTVLAIGETLPKGQLIAHDDYADKHDPHIWMDPSRWQYVINSVQQVLSEKRPSKAPYFEENAKNYLLQLDTLAKYANETLQTVPSQSRVLLSAHDAFNYFGETYGFEVIGIQGISTESEAGLFRVAELVDLLVEQDIKAVFVESSVSDRSIRALIEGAAAKGHEVRIGGSLYSDAMGAPGTYEGTYIGMIDHNTTTIALALGGDAPAKGHLGKLTAVAE